MVCHLPFRVASNVNICLDLPYPTLQIPLIIVAAAALEMSGNDADENQSVVEDGGQGPGAPTPLTVLEVRTFAVHSFMEGFSNLQVGSRWALCS